ncbi:D-alanine--D-alanine ligase [Kineobactrum sediminis]|uniref:D-alanine--D-alanine ligase n=1 Tax=Kineobactrum sediminis TaxID=1905677 RepID=A0A2N5Y6K8_9GAMM|nr:D-alanine--D-alanine ligase [Kineobactrum sediminis]PLW84011.1 D-alanine--D-alanine ligase [Kineobactrum sediminis]
MVQNVFVIGYDSLGKKLLPNLRHVEDCEFHGLLSMEKVISAETYEFDRLVDEAVAELQAFPGSVDAVVGYWDFPTSGLVPVVRKKMGLPGPSLRSVLKCEHKYWSRLEQKRSVPECVPSFQAVDPFADNAVETITIDYPFWIKPIKAHSSHLGFLVETPQQLSEVLPRIRAGIGRFGEPFAEMMAHLDDLPEEIATVTGHHCIAEGIISGGRQCTLEGYARHGEVHLVGIVDSIRDPTHNSVLVRYEYPSCIPDAVKQRMLDYSRRFITAIGYDNSPFNIEFFYDEDSDEIRLLEVNARLSRSHAVMFQLVDGNSHLQVMVDLALDRDPRMPHREGPCAVAAKQMLRVFEPGIVRRAPLPEEVRQVETRFPGSVVQLHVHEGMDLSELQHQDSFSWELAVVFIGADTEAELKERIEICRKMLPFEIEPATAEA